MFSIGIDPALQRSMPPLWRHYFDPNLPWPADPLSSQTIYPMPPLPALPGPPVEIVPPILTHQIPTKYTPPGTHDKVQGTVQLRIVVDEQGVPRRIAVTRPLGYGLDQQAADAVAQWRFNPGLHAGQSVPSAILVNIDFQLPPPQR
jgi:TonB family protein